MKAAAPFAHVQKAASGCSGRRCSKCYCRCLEGEIHAGADHAEVVVRPIHEIPAEITDPADMRGEADFQAAADLADCLRLAICVTSRLENVEAFSGVQ